MLIRDILYPKSLLLLLFVISTGWPEEKKLPSGAEKPTYQENSWLVRFRIISDWQLANSFYSGKGAPKRPEEAKLLWAKIGRNEADSEHPDIASIIGLANLQAGNFPAAIKAFEKAAVYYGPYYKNLNSSSLSLVPRGSREDKCLVRILDKKGEALGSGAYIWNDGLVLTAAHVVNDRSDLVVQDYEGKIQPVLGVFVGSLSSDLAAIKTKGPSPFYFTLAPSPFFKQDDLKILGFPFGSMVPITSTGKVEDTVDANVGGIKVVKCDLSSVPGYSGAPALEPTGKLTGVVSMCRIENPYLKDKKQHTYLVTYEDLNSFLSALKGAKKFAPLGNSDWGKKCPYWNSDWCKNDNLISQALYYIKSDPEKSIELFEDAADEGSSSALLVLGQIYFAGEIAPRDLDKAFKFYLRAAKAGEPAGMLMSGLSYLGGYGVNKDEQKGIEMIHKAAEADYPNALIYLSSLYQKGNAVPADRALSLYYSRRAAQTMEPVGMSGHIANLAKDENSSDNKSEMYEWCRIYAQTGSPNGQVVLALCYLNGFGTELNYEIAKELLMKAADQGEPQAFVQLCVINFMGKGCEVNYQEATKWANKAADSGSDKGHFFIFLCEAVQKEKRNEAVSADAFSHLQKACDLGLADAQFYYGQCLLEGLHGTSKDYPKALALLKKAKDNGFQKASAYIPLAQMEVDKQTNK